MARIRWALGALVGLAGCGQAEIDQPPVSVTAKEPGAAVGLDVYAQARAAGNTVPRFRGQETLTVRAYGDLGDGWDEVSGAICLLDSGLYTANFVTPATVAVPDYGPASPAVFVRCTAGARTGSATVEAFDQTAADRSDAALGTGLVGAAILGVVNATTNDAEANDWAYPSVEVRMR